MDTIAQSVWIVAIALHIGYAVALAAIAQALRHAFGIWSPSWITLYFVVTTCASYAQPSLTKWLFDDLAMSAGPHVTPFGSVTLGQLISLPASFHVIFHQLAAFGLLALALADLVYLVRDNMPVSLSKWSGLLDRVRRHGLAVGLATLFLALAPSALVPLAWTATR